MRYLRSECLKEKRSANRMLLWVTPPVFILFSFLASQLMAEAPVGKSYLITVAFNWYPMLILPVVLALLSVNSMSREKSAQKDLFHARGVSDIKIKATKMVVSWMNYALILMVSLVLLIAVEALVLGHAVPWRPLMKATLLLFAANAFALPFNAWLFSYLGRVAVLLLNFFLYFVSAVVAVTPYWFFFPWCYGAVFMAPVLGIHPNGTFLLPDHPLMDPSLVPAGIGASALVCVCMLGLLLGFSKKELR